ncbi:MAG: Pr6Pr family membrane protein [Polymorphobacter sp.]
MESTGTRGRSAAAAIAALVFVTIAAQLTLNIAAAPAKGVPLWRVPIDLYGYFTIWSNTLVALVTWRFARGNAQGLLGRPSVQASTVVYIIVVGVIYNTLLVQYNPQTGVRLLIDTIFHTIVPIAYPLWWLAFVPRGRLDWTALAPAVIFPVVYGLFALAKGAMTGKYAYFFINVGKYGMPQVLLNIAALGVLYAALMALVIALDRWVHRRRGATA